MKGQSPFFPFSVKGKRLIHVWYNVIYLRSFITDNHTERDKVPNPEPWSNDECLKIFKDQTVINRSVKLLHKLVEAMETVSIGTMPKTESIPMLWETVKDLIPESLLDL